MLKSNSIGVKRTNNKKSRITKNKDLCSLELLAEMISRITSHGWRKTIRVGSRILEKNSLKRLKKKLWEVKRRLTQYAGLKAKNVGFVRDMPTTCQQLQRQRLTIVTTKWKELNFKLSTKFNKELLLRYANKQPTI